MQLKFHGQIPAERSRRPGRSGKTSLGRVIIAHPLFSVLIAGIVLAYAFGHVGPSYEFGGALQPTAPGQMVLDSTASLTSVIGRLPVVLLVDVSGSMDDQEDQARLRKYLRELDSKKLLLGRVDIDGAGITSSSGVRNLVYGIEKALTYFPDLRALYVLSDFDTSYAPYWETDDVEQELVKNILTHNKVPLYLGTVRFQPGALHQDLALESGGGIVFHK